MFGEHNTGSSRALRSGLGGYTCTSIGNPPMCCSSLRVLGRQGDSLPVARDAAPKSAPWYVPRIRLRRAPKEPYMQDNAPKAVFQMPTKSQAI